VTFEGISSIYVIHVSGLNRKAKRIKIIGAEKDPQTPP